jgi:acyl-CoA synthetase (AMP-forming)/AMP-acid ligase II
MGTGGKPLSLIDLLQVRSQISPDLPVQTFLADGQRAERVLTSANLFSRARAIGAVLQQNGLAGRTVLLLYPPGLDFVEAFFGCLLAGAIAVPAYPPKANRSFGRLRAIVRDAGAAGVLSIGTMLGGIRDRLEGEGVDSIRLWLATDEVPDETDGWRDPRVAPDSLAFLQYTSGSTGEPKGVMVSHANVLHNSECIKRAFRLSPQSVGVCWLPSFHDMGLITGVFAPIYTGFRHYIMAPAAFLQKPVRWLEAIWRLGATFSGGPNSAYELCLRSISPEQCRDLDLRCWTVAFNGAEPIRAETLRRFADAFAPYGFDPRAWLPGYGMAEATLMVSCGPTGSGAGLLHVRESDLQQHQLTIVPADAPDAVALVASGQPGLDTEVAVVHPEQLTRCPDGRIGELWVRSPSVAHGYWQRRQQSEATFAACLADTGEGPFLRTGDLG